MSSLALTPTSPRALKLPFKPGLSAGFTLLELSIVLVIIGLLIGGLFVGQSLIKNAQIGAVIQEYGRYQAATQAFKEQYRGLPGDLSNAGQLWGYANAAPATCKTTASTTTATCDGDGDGNIYDSTGSVEQFRYWQQLANAKMIEGSYTGVYNGANATPGLNLPSSKYSSNVGWSVVAPVVNLPSNNYSWTFATDYGTGHVFFLGAQNNWLAAYAPGMANKDAWSIDKKIDDGKPATGNVIASYFTSCVGNGTGAGDRTDLSATYKLSTSGQNCLLMFLADF